MSDDPIPQNAARQRARRESERQREQKEVIDAYETIGRRNPRWDEEARTALRAVVDHWSAPHDMRSEHWLIALESASKAVAAGCEDPLIRYLSVRYYYGYNPDPKAQDERVRRAQVCQALRGLVPDMLASRYSVSRKGHACVNAAGILQSYEAMTPQLRREIEQLLETCLAQVTAILSDAPGDALARQTAFDICLPVMANGFELTKDRMVWYEKVLAAIGTNPAVGALRHRVEGSFFIKYAWDARGAAAAGAVTDDGWARFGERLRRAEQALTAAWAADSEYSEVAADMIIVCTGLGYDRATMEQWFRRAMETDGDNQDACSYKLTYLLPKWYGNADEVARFGRQCRDTRNWFAGRPAVLVAAHRQLCQDSSMERLRYYNQPSVWRDIESVYSPLLKDYPQARRARTEFFRLSAYSGMKGDASDQLTILGDDPWKPVFDNEEECQILKDYVRGKRPSPR